MLAIALALRLEERLTNRTAPIAVVSNGDSGLAIAREIADRSFRVRMVNLDPGRVVPVSAPVRRQARRSVPRLERRTATDRRLEITADPAALAEAEVTLICVPIPAARNLSDLSHIIEAAKQVASQLRPGNLIVLGSLGYPGMTEDLVRPILESTGFRVGKEIFLAFVSRRRGKHAGWPGGETPQVVGGSDRISARLGLHLMAELGPRVVPLSSPAAAEMASLLGATVCSVNLALMNRLAQLCHAMGFSVWEVIEAVLPIPLRSAACGPGLGNGPDLLTQATTPARSGHAIGLPVELIEVARQINDGMPDYIVDRLLTIVQGRSSAASSVRIVVLGNSPEGVQEHSSVSRIVGSLRGRNMNVAYHDPNLPRFQLNDGEVLESCMLTEAVLREADCVLLLGAPNGFDYETIVRNARLVFDVGNVTKELVSGREKIVLL